ncbi:prepilin peptidase, partial [Aeromonas aquatica]
MVLLIELAQGLPWLYLSLIFIFSLMIGSFLNVVIHRLPIMLEREWHAEYRGYFDTDTDASPTAPYNLMVPRSACPHCGHPIGALENIPLLSWLWLKGRCR